MGKPPFFLRVGRTSVRYMASYVHCVRIVYLVRRCHSALRVRVILSHGGEGRESLAGPLVGFQYISCRLVFSSRLASRFSSRGGVSLCFSFPPSRCRLLVVASCRLVSFHSCVVLVADACMWRCRSWVVSCRSHLVVGVSSRSSALCLASPVASFLVPVSPCVSPSVAGRRLVWGRGVDVPCHHAVRVMVFLFPYF